jgi:hypothetical protein
MRDSSKLRSIDNENKKITILLNLSNENNINFQRLFN